ncbi:MAG TPA: hypothetical protein VGW57_01105 [Chthoniobacterales bacterium]|nr:hypothetical protein [Chthoniobacterales bacterium]
MTDTAKRPPSTSNVPGLSVADFDVCVETFVKLREANKISLFLTRNSTVRVIGDRNQFAIALTNSLGLDELQTDKANEFLGELRSIASIFLPSRNAEEVVTYLEKYQFETYLKQVSKDAEAKASFHATLRRKVDTVVAKLLSSTLLERAKRFVSAAGPTLEELDCEIVSQRHSWGDEEDVISPFLRLRLRYSEGADFRFPFRLPWMTGTNDAKSFELECDETDIDLLVSRLLEAKKFLSEALSAKVKAGEAPRA